MGPYGILRLLFSEPLIYDNGQNRTSSASEKTIKRRFNAVGFSLHFSGERA